jgi:hypothetical protein
MNPTHIEGEEQAGVLLRPWHKLRAWWLVRRIRRQHRELARYVRRSAYEISAWKQDIGFLDDQLAHHLARAGLPLGLAPAAADKVVSMEDVSLAAGAIQRSVAS